MPYFSLTCCFVIAIRTIIKSISSISLTPFCGITCFGCKSLTEISPLVVCVCLFASHSTKKKFPPCTGVIRSSISFSTSNGKRSTSFLRWSSIVFAKPSSSFSRAVTFGIGIELSTCASTNSATILRTTLAGCFCSVSVVNPYIGTISRLPLYKA